MAGFRQRLRRRPVAQALSGSAAREVKSQSLLRKLHPVEDVNTLHRESGSGSACEIDRGPRSLCTGKTAIPKYGVSEEAAKSARRFTRGFIKFLTVAHE